MTSKRSSRAVSAIALAPAVACALLLLAGCGRGKDTSTAGRADDVLRIHVQVAPVVVGDVTQEVELVGSLVARQCTRIVTDVDGVIVSLAASKQVFELGGEGNGGPETLALGLGQSVKKGEVLVQIDRKDYALGVAAAKADLAAAKTSLVQLRAWRRPEVIRGLKAARDEASARVDLATLELDRAKELRAKKIVSASEFDSAESALSVARAAHDAAEAALAVALNGPTPPEIALAEARIAQAQALVNVRQDDLDRTTIRAPYDGVITERFVDVGERVTAMPRIEILEVMDLSLVFVEVGVPERYIHQVNTHDPVRVRAEGVTEPFPGTVVLVNDKVDTQSRTYRVRVGVSNRTGRLMAGQFVRVAFAIQSASQQLVVPQRAVTYQGGQPQVFVYAGGKVDLRDVRQGLSDGALTEIVSGVQAGEQVVVDDPAVLSDGMPVEVRQAPAGSRR